MSEHGKSTTKRPKLLEEAVKGTGITVADALGLAADGVLPIAVLVKPHLGCAVWVAENDGNALALANVFGRHSRVPTEAEFAYIDALADDSDFRSLAAPDVRIRGTRFHATSAGPFAFGERSFARLTALVQDGVSLGLDDLWVMPEDRPKLVPDATNAVPDAAEASPRHESQLLLCIGVLAKMLAAADSRFAPSRKGLPWKVKSLAEAVEAESGARLTAKTITNWLPKAKAELDLASSEGDDE